MKQYKYGLTEDERTHLNQMFEVFFSQVNLPNTREEFYRVFEIIFLEGINYPLQPEINQVSLQGAIEEMTSKNQGDFGGNELTLGDLGLNKSITPELLEETFEKIARQGGSVTPRAVSPREYKVIEKMSKEGKIDGTGFPKAEHWEEYMRLLSETK